MINEETVAVVSFTTAAQSKLAEVLAEQDASESYLRIAAAMTPAGGIEYQFGIEDEPSDADTAWEDGAVKALVDAASIPMIAGSSIDYVEGFQRSGFVISNPRFAGGCGGGGGGCACGGGGGGCGCAGGGGGGGCGGH